MLEQNEINRKINSYSENVIIVKPAALNNSLVDKSWYIKKNNFMPYGSGRQSPDNRNNIKSGVNHMEDFGSSHNFGTGLFAGYSDSWWNKTNSSYAIPER